VQVSGRVAVDIYENVVFWFFVLFLVWLLLWVFCVAVVFVGLRFWLWLRFGLFFGVCLVVVVVVAYLGTTVRNASGCIWDVA
jgi:hypothetical protein